ncbi:hypothetical protein V8F06_003488 [Rhypophila decipiens]
MSTKSVRSWMPPIPRPLERLFNSVPLLTYDANELPARAQSSTASDIPTLYVFSTEEDARKGLPSFNPKCLKWQTFLKLSKIPFNIIPSTNHASPTSQLPFLLPARKTSLPASTTPGGKGIEPIPSNKLEDWVLSQKQNQNQASPEKQDDKFHPRQEAYQSLLDVPLRNSWLYTLYLDPTNSNLVEKLYIHPSSSSYWIRATLRHQLRRAAESAILTTTHSVSSGGPAHGVVHPDEIYRSAKEALEALAYELSIDNRGGAEGNTGWFFGATEPGLFDAEVFAYVYLMVRFFSRPESAEGEKESGLEEEETRPWLGNLVRQAGEGELVGHMNRILELTWPDLVVRDA